ncbi:hypothetical protein [Streptomyces sp. NPDC006334]|uniref:hypothetical protein n=1 Tax=Streptomyces sp. NPDC006334 TaxID=3156754 RepID=UPI0033B4366B
MRITLLTPEQAREVCATITAWFERLREQLLALGQRLIETARQLVRLAPQIRAARTRPDRPAWASPYGPTPKRPAR